ncbi:hypothetical protein PYCC9005_000747 [Savitreella phatthalungensis]
MLQSFILSLHFLVWPVKALYANGGNVQLATDANFDALVNGSPLLSIVEFYAPWCGHCKNLAPVYKQAADKLKGLVNVVAVDCDDRAKTSQVCGRNEIKGFPTIKSFRPVVKKGRRTVEGELYNGGRTLGDILRHTGYIMPSAVDNLKDGEMSEWFEKEQIKVILFSKKGAIPPVYKAMSTRFPSLLFGLIRYDQKEALVRFQVSEFPTLLVLDGSEVTRFEGEMRQAEIASFLSTFGSDILLSQASKFTKSKSTARASAVHAPLLERLEEFDAVCSSQTCLVVPGGLDLVALTKHTKGYHVLSIAPNVHLKLAERYGLETNTFVFSGSKRWLLPANGQIETISQVLQFVDDVKLGQAGRKLRFGSDEL